MAAGKRRTSAANPRSDSGGWRERALSSGRFLGLVVDNDEAKGGTDEAVAALRRAKGLLDAARFMEGLEHCQKAIALCPDWHEPYLIQGLLEWGIGWPIVASASLEKCGELCRADQPGRWFLSCTKAEVLLQAGLPEEALAACNEVDASHQHEKELIRVRKKIARVSEKKGSQILKHTGRSLYYLGFALCRRDLIHAAIPVFRRARELSPAFNKLSPGEHEFINELLNKEPENNDYATNKAPYNEGDMKLDTAYKMVARDLGCRVEDLEKLRKTKPRADIKAKPRVLWENRKDEDAKLTPPEFIAKHYAAEMAAGTLHRGVIAQEDKPLAVKLASWLRSNPMPEGVDIPTKPEWNTRQLAKLHDDPAAQEIIRLHEVAKLRAVRAARVERPTRRRGGAARTADM
jgi:tetratricopeptide (TPR) repeat protein